MADVAVAVVVELNPLEVLESVIHSLEFECHDRYGSDQGRIQEASKIKLLTTKSMSFMASTGMEASGRGHCGAALI